MRDAGNQRILADNHHVVPADICSFARPRRWRHRFAAAVLVVATTIALHPGVASADPAEPTNYRSEVTGAQPALPDGVTAKVVGGDGFLEVSSDGHEVLVLDAKQPGEREARPFLRLARDGTVQLNRNAVGYYYNDSRYGGAVPARVLEPDLAADWTTVGDDGSYVWHDHRIHWMSPSKPPSVPGSSGRVDLGGPDGDWTVDLRVDGRPTTLSGHLDLLDAPSPVPWYLAIVVVAGLLVLLGGRWPVWATSIATLVAAGLATVAGWATHDAVPPAAGGTPVTWLLPLAALVAAMIAVVAAITHRPRAASIAALGSACLLAGWVLMRLPVLSHAVLPTVLAAPIDRTGTALAAGVAIGVAVVVVRSGALSAGRPVRETRPTASPTA